MVDVVIVNWNSGLHLRNCVDSVLKYGAGLVSKLIVVDNGSTDGSEACVDGLPNCRLIRAGANLGFARACNLGAREACSEHLLFLNPDAALFADTLPKAVAFLSHPENGTVGICGVQLLDEAGRVSRSCARFPSMMRFAVDATGVNRILPGLGHFMSNWDHRQNRQVDHVIGAFFLVRRQLFDLLNGFDERFFLYLEGLDFSLRARQAGWRSMYLAEVQAFHAGGGSSKQVKALRLFYLLRSRLLYAAKHFSWMEAAGVFLITLFVEPLSRLALALLQRSRSGLKETWAAYGMLFGWLPQWLTAGVTR